jgi:hypothetical protein
VLAELEENERVVKLRPAFASNRAARAKVPITTIPSTPRDQPSAEDPQHHFALDDLEDGPTKVPPLEQDDVAPAVSRASVEDLSADDLRDEFSDAGFEILAEAALDESPFDVVTDAGSANPLSSNRVAAIFDEAQRGSPRVARQASVASAIARPTWTRTPDFDPPDLERSADPGRPYSPTPSTIPGRVPTKEIDLESALDALDIEADAAPVAKSLGAPIVADDDDVPIELEFED